MSPTKCLFSHAQVGHQGGIQIGGPELAPQTTACWISPLGGLEPWVFTCAGHQGGIQLDGPEMESPFFTCPGHPEGYPTWWSRAGTMFVSFSRPPTGVSNMIVPRKDSVFERVQATQGGI
eukprot:1704392-Pyramimonas_sp.AAC.1